MEPADLSDDELQYELEIRGKPNIEDKRLATKTLRAELEKERKGEKGISNNTSKPLSASSFLLPLELVVEGLRKEVAGAVGRDAANAKKVLNSKLIHYSGRVKRLQGTDAAEVKRIEGLYKDIMKCLEITRNATDKDVFLPSNAGVQRSPQQSSTGAIPKNRPEKELPQHNVTDETQSDQQENAVGNSIIHIDSDNNEHRESGEIDRRTRNNGLSDRTHGDLNRISDLRNDGSMLMRENRSNSSNSFGSMPIRPTYPSYKNQQSQLHSNSNDREGMGRKLNASFPPNGFSANHISQHNFNDLSQVASNMPQQRNANNLNAVYFPTQIANNNSSAGGQPFLGMPQQPQRANYAYQYGNYPGNNNNNNNYNFSNNNIPNRTMQPQAQPQQYRRRNPVADWNLSFSGDNKDMSVNDFLSRVALFARAEKVTGDDLISSAVYLFKGRADIWFRAFGPYFNTWEQLVQGLKAQFLPVDYDFWLHKEIEQRLQGESEDFGIFSAAMEMMFRNLSTPLPEHQKLAIVMRNMLPIYSDRLSLMYVDNLPQLGAMCKRIEESRYRVNRQAIPQIQRRDLLEPAYSYQPPNFPRQRVAEIECIEEGELDAIQVAQITYKGQRLSLCYNCGEPGHQHSQCRSERKLFCYKCGMVGYITRNCVRCHSNDRGNANAGSNRGVRTNSHSTQTQTPL